MSRAGLAFTHQHAARRVPTYFAHVRCGASVDEELFGLRAELAREAEGIDALLHGRCVDDGGVGSLATHEHRAIQAEQAPGERLVDKATILYSRGS